MKGGDFYCGAGGFALALERAGIDVVLAVNHWSFAMEVHAANHLATEHLHGTLIGDREPDDARDPDVPVIRFEDLQPFDFLTAGPSCQGHSLAGNMGRAASRNVLDDHAHMRSTAWAVHKCLQICRPKYLVVENVPGFIRWADLDEWEMEIRSLGYSFTRQKLLASRFGLPQRRRRWIFIGVLDGPEVHLSDPDVPEPGVESIFDATATGWIEISKMRGKFGRTEKGHFTGKEKARISNERLGGALGIGQHTNYGYWGIPASEPVNTITSRAGQLWWTCDGHYRLWSEREYKRAQGFRDDYNLCGATKEQASLLLGNAVPETMAYAAIQAARGLPSAAVVRYA